MIKLIVISVLLLVVITKSEYASICKMPMFKKYKHVTNHVVCSNKSSLFRYSEKLSMSQKQYILSLHNEARKNVSLKNMNKMYWDNELTFISQKTAKKCPTNWSDPATINIPGRFITQDSVFIDKSKSHTNSSTQDNVISLWEKIRNYIGSIADLKDMKLDITGSQLRILKNALTTKNIKVGCAIANCSNTNIFVCTYQVQKYSDNNKLDFTDSGETCSNCQNCTEGLCDCSGLVCLNGGTLNQNNCTCSCPVGFTGPDCVLNCTITLNASCNNKSHEYKYCPEAGIGVTGNTNGKGTLLLFLNESNIPINGNTEINRNGGVKLEIKCVLILLLLLLLL